METTQQISNDSFSLNWLSNIKHSLDFLEESLRRSFDGLDGNSFIEMDPDFFSLRWTNSIDFDFSLPSCDGPLVVHADQIFFNGHLLPLQVINTSKNNDGSITLSKNWDDSVSTNSSPSFTSSDTMTMKSCHNKQKLPLLKRNTKSPVKMLRKYLYFLIPLYKKVLNLKKASSKMPRSFDDSPRSPPRMSIERRRGNRVFDVPSESSIHDAVLHCKKSIANSA
ncbi:hypothetical protein M5K25_024320 [Dendrobium thyrsiflorum]|uniref:Membrane-associated kinase regulator 6 n=1 Tax=Dendrobium thyrsiflorum TaxID=117978 RepID=A0ABD0U218_DENTH